MKKILIIVAILVLAGVAMMFVGSAMGADAGLIWDNIKETTSELLKLSPF